MVNDSLKTRLQAARQRAQHRQTRDFPIPGTEDTLWGTFKALDDYRDSREIVSGNEQVPDVVDKELYTAADTILKSSVALYVLDGGERVDLEFPLGAQAAAELYDDQVENDRQGIFAIFPNTLTVASFFAELQQWFSTEQKAADREIAGNSGAPS